LRRISITSQNLKQTTSSFINDVGPSGTKNWADDTTWSFLTFTVKLY